MTRHSTQSHLRFDTAFFVVVLGSLISPMHVYGGNPDIRIFDVRVGSYSDKTRIVFDLSEPASFSLEPQSEPNRIVLTLNNTQINNQITTQPMATPVDHIEVARTAEGDVRYTFVLDRAVQSELFALKPYQERGDRLVLDLYNTAETAAKSPASPQSPEAPATAKTSAKVPLSAKTHSASTRRAANKDASGLGDYYGEWTGYFSLDTRLFAQKPAYSDQDNQNVSLAVQPEYFARWANGSQRMSFIPFYRYDANDSKRTHTDIRELYWQIDYQRISVKAGIDVVFWGVAESQHLVDIINQTDLVENLDGEEKLGQPMLNLDYMSDLGTWQLYLLPYFRDRTFPGRHGRLRNDPPVDMGGAIYESSDKQKHVDFALRWSRAIGDWDIGVGHFSGTSREAALFPSDAKPRPYLVPFYPQIDQTSLDAQATKGAWLWKLEAIYNQNNFNNYYAYVAGFEFTQFGIAQSASDLGWLIEYHYDERGDLSTDELIPTALASDIYLGMRWTGNDVAGTRLLAGLLIDTGTQSTFANLEYNRRLGELWTIGVEARVLTNIDKQDLFYPIRKDDYIGIQFTRYY